MNAIKRASIYLIRKKVRTLLLLCLLFLMSLSVLIGFSLKESTERELERLRLSMASGFVLRAFRGTAFCQHGKGSVGGGL